MGQEARLSGSTRMTARFALAVLLIGLGTAAAAQAVTVSGTVKRNNVAVSGRTVTLRLKGGFSTETAVTAADGTWSCDVLAGCWLPEVDDQGTIVLYGDTVLPINQKEIVVKTQPVDGVNFNLPAFFNFGGTISTPNTPLPGNVRIQLTDDEGVSTSLTWLFSTTGGGNYARMIPPGTYKAMFSDPASTPTHATAFYGGQTTLSEASTFTVINAAVNNINASLPRIATFSGVVTSSLNPGVRVGLIPDSSLGSFGIATTDSTGNFTIAGNSSVLVGDRVRIGVLPTTGKFIRGLEDDPDDTLNGWGKTFEVMPGPNTGHDITPLNLFSVAGKITDGTNPVAGAQVTLQDAQSRTVRGSQFLTGLTNATGDFLLNGAMPGWYFLQTFNSGSTNFLLNKNTPIFLVNGNVTGQNIVVGKGAKGTFTVTHNGTPVFFAFVTGINAACTTFLFSGYTDQAGVLRTITFPAGDAHVWVTTPNHPDIGDNATGCATAPLVNFPVEVDTPLAVSLPDGTPVTGQRVFGRVIANNPTNGIPFASVSLRNNAGTRSFFEFTDYCGDWEVMNVPPDTYDVSFSATGFAGRSDNDGVIVVNAEVNDGVTTLNRLTGSIEGHFRDAAGDPIMGATACALGTAGRCAREVSDNTGYYTIDGLADGAYPVVGRTYGLYNPQLLTGNATVTGGGSVVNVNFNLSNVGNDGSEAGDLVPLPNLLTHRPDAGPSMAELRPNGTPVTRAIRDLEDVDWFRFAVTAGQKYTLTITGPVSSVFGFFRGVFDSTRPPSFPTPWPRRRSSPDGRRRPQGRECSQSLKLFRPITRSR